MPIDTATLCDSVRAGDLRLRNRVVMAPLTRNRAPHALLDGWKDVTHDFQATARNADETAGFDGVEL